MAADATRRDLLRHGLGVGLGAGLGGAGATPLLASAARAATLPVGPRSEADRLRRMLSVKLLSLFVYQEVLASAVLGARANRDLTPLRGHEQAHVQVLGARLQAIGSALPIGPATIAAANRDLAHRAVPGRLGQLHGRGDALGLLLGVERVTIGVCFVALTKLEDPLLIRLAAQIMAVDAQHEAVVGEISNRGNGAMAVPYGLVQGVQ